MTPADEGPGEVKNRERQEQMVPGSLGKEMVFGVSREIGIPGIAGTLCEIAFKGCRSYMSSEL